ncbi:MAG: GNAT family N-acetyltransferase [Acidimicrobiia bacterium]|nr:GNAT family N-acetyltransferase [Acidimicrobiia bacterium]
MAVPWRFVTAGSEAAETTALLWAQADASRRGEAIPSAISADTVAKQVARLSRPRAIAVIGYLGSVPVACCHAEPARDDDVVAGNTSAHLSGVAVHPDHWARGIGRSMIGYVLDELDKAGYDAVQLLVLESNSRARRLYERTGWHLERLGAPHPQGPHAVYHRAVP